MAYHNYSSQNEGGARTHSRFPRRRFGGPRRDHSRGSFRARPRQENTIHYSKFINKASGPVEEAVYEPTHRFTDFPVDERLKQAIEKKGYTTPTPIQDSAIPHALKGKDVVGLANTGTGKTAAFLIPLIDKILRNPQERVLIMAPTRELAVQIEEELRGFTPGMRIFSAVLIGGANINTQISQLRRRPNFVIGTPGRIMDIMERKEIDLSRFGTVVLDEADRMLDMGFLENMRFILSHLPERRHTLCFSATITPEIERLIGQFLKDPARVSVRKSDTAKTVDQDVVRVPAGRSKLDHLAELLSGPEFEKVIVFGRTKHGVEKLSRLLGKMGIGAESIHGNKTQNQRQRALRSFKENRVKVLVATDVAARGLDIPKVSHVINYDVPQTYEDYVHRIGRTGRAGERGKALTFID